MHDVFISYSSKEYGAAEAVRVMLEEKGISCWMAPGCIPGGSNYTKEIPVAIRKCQVFVLILSKNAQASHWVLKELDSAVGHGKVILPFMLENFTLSDEFSFLLSGTQWYSAYLDADAELDKMVERILSITSGGKPRKHSPKPAPKKPRPDPKPKPEPAPKDEPKTEAPSVPEVLVRCPACNGPFVQPLKNGKKSYDFAESMHFLLVPLIPAAILALGASFGYGIGFSDDFGNLMFVFACLILSLIGTILGIRSAKENIRRRRVRKHIRASGAICSSCAKKFRVAVPFGTAFPWEVPEQNDMKEESRL